MKFKLVLPFLLAAALGGILCGCDRSADGEHQHAAATWQTVTAPTCSETGSATGICVECGEELHIELDEIPHTYTETVIPPTCEKEGYTLYACACGYSYEGNQVPPIEHTLTETVIPPTCEEEGYTLYACTCGYSYDGKHVPPTVQTLTETVIPPTCEEEGYTRYICACGYTYDGDHIPPIGHTLTETVTVLPTCTEEGYTRYECAVCNYTQEGNPVAPLAHANSTAETYHATVNRTGYTLYTCQDCGYSYEGDYVQYRDIVSGAYVDNTEILKQGIDTSKWNHEYGVSLEDMKPLDWEALKAAGVDFVILKAGSTLGKDPAFERDYLDAKAAGLEVGAYFYAYSTTVEGTVQDANMLLAWLEGKQFEYPIYFDAEDDTISGLGQELLTEMCVAFMERLQEEGYYAALYTNTEWLYNLLDTEFIKNAFDVWYARYVADMPDGSSSFSLEDTEFTWKDGTAYQPGEPDKRYGIWQYTQYGRVDGFRYRFDFNYSFKDYKPIMVKWGLNGF